MKNSHILLFNELGFLVKSTTNFLLKFMPPGETNLSDNNFHIDEIFPGISQFTEHEL